MSATAPTPAQLVRLLSSIRRQEPSANRLGIRFEGAWTGPDRLRVDGEEFRVVACRSSLEARELLAEAGPEEKLVLLTERDEHDLGRDVVARLARRRVLPMDPWIVLLELFSARSIEKRLTRERWLTSALLDAAPAEGYGAVPTGYLDFETAWDAFARAVLRLSGGRPDVLKRLDHPDASLLQQVFHLFAGATRVESRHPHQTWPQVADHRLRGPTVGRDILFETVRDIQRILQADRHDPMDRPPTGLEMISASQHSHVERERTQDSETPVEGGNPTQ